MLKMIARNFSHLCAPPFCWYCRAFLKARAPLCAQCIGLIKPIMSTELSLTQTKSMRVYALSSYEDPLKSLILAKNYSNVNAARALGQLIVEALPLESLPCDYVVPIPLHWTRNMWRGFNQARIIADVVGNNLNKPVIEALSRKKRTPFQAQLDARERAGNVGDAFVLGREADLLQGKHVVLVDDLMTTGATLMTVGKILLHLRPASIQAVVACRTL